MPYKNFGYVGADFTDYFVLTHSFGSGSPHDIELIQKSTGKNILKPGAAWIDQNEQKQILLYSDNDSPLPKDKMTQGSTAAKNNGSLVLDGTQQIESYRS